MNTGRPKGNQVGVDGTKIRAWLNPLEFAFNPGCGCCIVWAPDVSTNPDKPFVLKFWNYLCTMGHKRKT